MHECDDGHFAGSASVATNTRSASASRLSVTSSVNKTLQAFDWNEPVLPMRLGQVERRSHDYPRDGTTPLVAGLNSKSGKVISEFHRRSGRHSSVSCSTRSTPACRDSRTHETPAIHRWLARHSRVHLHFTPTGSSWMDLVERWFAALTKKELRRVIESLTQDTLAAHRYSADRGSVKGISSVRTRLAGHWTAQARASSLGGRHTRMAFRRCALLTDLRPL